METDYGPTISGRARLLAEGQWGGLPRAEIIDLAGGRARITHFPGATLVPYFH
jgi:hypothetical protein